MDDQEYQSTQYRKYFDLVAEFSEINNNHLVVVADIANQRQQAVAQAIKIHIQSIVGRLQAIQVVCVLAAIVAVAVVLNALSKTPAVGDVKSFASVVFGGILTVIVAGIGVVAVIVLLWAMGKTSQLNQRARAATETRPSILSQP